MTLCCCSTSSGSTLQKTSTALIPCCGSGNSNSALKKKPDTTVTLNCNSASSDSYLAEAQHNSDSSLRPHSQLGLFAVADATSSDPYYVLLYLRHSVLSICTLEEQLTLTHVVLVVSPTHVIQFALPVRIRYPNKGRASQDPSLLFFLMTHQKQTAI